jgi:hypothetical protein
MTVACALPGVPAGLGFLTSGEAVATDMHARSSAVPAASPSSRPTCLD